ncbi:MAG: hypothetical protein IT337_11655 [Thermomicrobiales bacterium]|nr:hypothetical protein [Thermomicrobiales bacterium]
MTTFSKALEPWRDFYMLAGTAAATLMGLLFVAISLLPGVMADRGAAGLRAWVAQTMSNLVMLLVLALLCLMPELSGETFAVVLLVAAAQGIARGVWRLRYIVRENRDLGHWRLIFLRGVLPLVTYAVLVYVAYDSSDGAPDSLGLLVVAVFFLVTGAAGAAWQLLEEMGVRAANAREAEPVRPARRGAQPASALSARRKARTKRSSASSPGVSSIGLAKAVKAPRS